MIVTDPDAKQSAIDTNKAVISSAGAIGFLTIDASGHWNYTVDNNAIQYLGQSTTKTEIFTVTSIDGTTHDITIVLTGTNDIPILSTGNGSIIEDTTTAITGKLTITDPDAGQSSFQAQAPTPTQYGIFTITATGEWTYALDNTNPKVQALAQGVTTTETITVLSADGMIHLELHQPLTSVWLLQERTIPAVTFLP